MFRYKGGYRSLTAIAGRSIIVIAAIAAAVFAGTQVRLAMLRDVEGGWHAQLEFEIRLPASSAEPNRNGLDFELQAGSQRSDGLLRSKWLRRDGDRLVVAGLVPLYTRTWQRILVMSRPGEPKLIFRMRLADTPVRSEQYGAWQRVDYVDDLNANSQPRAPTAAEAFEIRYRVPRWHR